MLNHINERLTIYLLLYFISSCVEGKKTTILQPLQNSKEPVISHESKTPTYSPVPVPQDVPDNKDHTIQHSSPSKDSVESFEYKLGEIDQKYLTEENLALPVEKIDLYNNIPNASNREETDPVAFAEIGKWEGSCGFEGEKLQNFLAGILPQKTSLAPHYFFFSLTAFSKGTSIINPEMKFYKTKDFINSKPDYILDSSGLNEKDKLICKWNMPYSEDYLYANFLPGCLLGNKHQFLSFVSTSEDQNSSLRICSVMNVEDYEIDKTGNFDMQVRIGQELYYLDISQMPNLKNGSLLLTKDKRKKHFEDVLAKRRKITLGGLNIIKASKEFKKMIECLNSKKNECLKDLFPESFLLELKDSGINHICNTGSSTSNKGPACDSTHDILALGAAQNYLKEFIESVTQLKESRFLFENAGPEMKSIKFQYYPVNLHTEMDAPSIYINVKDGKLIFSHFDDGLSC
ncbi:MAG: hypothetical protein V4598_08930 [Bdellovibrionota bacterium]